MSTVKKEYQALMIEHKRRQERNGRLLARLENIEKKAAFLQAKTDRIKSLKSIYRNQVEKKPAKNLNVYSNVDNRIITERVPVYIGPNNYDFNHYDPLQYSNYRYERIYNEPNPLYTLKPITLEDAIEEISRRFVLVPKEAENMKYGQQNDFKFDRGDGRREPRDENERRKQEFKSKRNDKTESVTFDDLTTDINNYIKERSKDLNQYETFSDETDSGKDVDDDENNIDVKTDDKETLENVKDIADEKYSSKDSAINLKAVTKNEPKSNDIKTIHTNDDIKEKTIVKTPIVTKKVESDNIGITQKTEKNRIQDENDDGKSISDSKHPIGEVGQMSDQIINESAKIIEENQESPASKQKQVLDQSQIEQLSQENEQQQNYSEAHSEYAENQVYPAEQYQEYPDQTHPELAGTQNYPEQVQQQYVEGQEYEQPQQEYVEGQIYQEQVQQEYVEGQTYAEQGYQDYVEGQVYAEQAGQEYVEQPGQEYVEQSGQEYVEQTGQEYVAQPGQEYVEQTAQEYPEQPDQEYVGQASHEYVEQPGQEYVEQTDQQFVGEDGQEYIEQPVQEYVEQTGQEYVEQTGQEYAEQTGQEHVEQPQEYVEQSQEYVEQSGQEYVEQPGQEYVEQTAQYAEGQNYIDPNTTGQEYYDQNQYNTGGETVATSEQYYQEGEQGYYNQDTTGQVYDESGANQSYIPDQTNPQESTSEYEVTYQEENNYYQQEGGLAGGDNEEAKPLKILESDTDQDGSKMDESSKQESDFDFSVAQ